MELVALEVFARQGYRNTTLDAVAERLGCTKQSIYYYYKNKEDLVLSLCRRILAKAKDDVIAITSSKLSPPEKLDQLIRYYLDMHSANPAFFALHRDMTRIMAELTDGEDKRALMAIMLEIPKATMGVLREGIERGFFIPEEPKTLSGIVFGMMSGIAMASDFESMKDMDVSARNSLAVRSILKGITL